MRVLLVAFEYPPGIGGGSSYNENLVKALHMQGVVVRVVTGGKDSSEDIYRYEELSDGVKGIFDIYRATDILIENIRDFKPDIIHTLHYSENLLAQVANVNFGLPLVSTLNRTPDVPGKKVSINGKWSIYDFASNRYTDSLIMISNFTKDRLLQSAMELSPKNIHVVYPGVDEKLFNPKNELKRSSVFRRELGVANDEILVFAPMVIRKRKGIEFLCKSLGSYSKVSKKKIKLIISGTDLVDETVIKQIQEWLGEAQLVTHKHFETSEMSMLYKTCDLTILASQSEGLGIALIEAIQSGSPVVASKIPGINEVIEDGYNGELVEYGDISGMVQSISRLLRKNGVRNRYIKNGYETISEKFNLQLQGSEHLTLYRQIIGSKLSQIVSIPMVEVNHKVYILMKKRGGYLQLIKSKSKNGTALSEVSMNVLNKSFGLGIIHPDYCYKVESLKAGNIYVYVYKLQRKPNLKENTCLVKTIDARKQLRYFDKKILTTLNQYL